MVEKKDRSLEEEIYNFSMAAHTLLKYLSDLEGPQSTRRVLGRFSEVEERLSFVDGYRGSLNRLRRDLGCLEDLGLVEVRRGEEGEIAEATELGRGTATQFKRPTFF